MTNTEVNNWPSWVGWVKNSVFLVFALAVTIQTVTIQTVTVQTVNESTTRFIDQSYWRELARPSIWLWVIGLALFAFGVHGWGTRTAMRWFYLKWPDTFSKFVEDIQSQKKERFSKYKCKVIFYLDAYVIAPIVEEWVFRWIPLFYALTPNHLLWLIAGGIIWPALHYDQVKRRTFWVRWSMLFFIGGLYLLPMLVVYSVTHNLIAALISSVLTHFLHNTFSAFTRYENWYLGLGVHGRESKWAQLQRDKN